jgi:hypothetical protein
MLIGVVLTRPVLAEICLCHARSCHEILSAGAPPALQVVLARDLLAAIGPQCRLVLIGDANQLPPVGPGQVGALGPYILLRS